VGAAVYHLSTKKAAAERDPDRDRLTNRREYRLRTNPRRSDTDRDGYGDAVEVRGGTDPRDPASHPGTGGGRAVTGRHGDSGPGRWIAGQTICLASGNYGIWHGVDKAV
jgi:hypothetical protein